MSLEELFPKRQADLEKEYISIRDNLHKAVREYSRKHNNDFRRYVLSAMDSSAQLYYRLNGSSDKEWMQSFHLNGAKPYVATIDGNMSDIKRIWGDISYERDLPEVYGEKIQILMDHCMRILNFDNY